MSSSGDLRSRWILGLVAVLAMAWAIARAAIQSITIDEANTYLQFVSRHLYLWYAANNHILNSTLMYGATRAMGASQFTVRLPALLGAALYIFGVYRFCRLLRTSLAVQLALFVCLVFNPFIFDYLVAARGYGLALAFLMWAMVYSMQEGFTVPACAVSSGCVGMSINANFSFAFVDLVAITVILFCALRHRPKEWTRLLAACIFPGAVTIAIVSGYALSHMHPGELIYGAASLRETFGSILEASLFQSPLNWLAPVVFPVVALTGLAWLLYSVARVPSLAWAAAAIFVVTVAIHWAAFRLFGLPLPKDRTAIFFFPLFMLMSGVLAAILPASALGQYLRGSFVAALVLMAVYFLSCLRLTYFKEWYWDADMQKTYAILSCLNREHNVTQVASSWSYSPSLRFYALAQPASLQIDEGPGPWQVDVKDTLHSDEPNSGLDQVFYKSPTTDLEMRAPSALAETYAAGSCLRLYKK
jgi:hypothetical protein